MTGNKEYEFGDGSKALASATTDAAEAAAAAVLDAGGTAVEAGAAAKKVIDDSGYQVTRDEVELCPSPSRPDDGSDRQVLEAPRAFLRRQAAGLGHFAAAAMTVLPR